MVNFTETIKRTREIDCCISIANSFNEKQVCKILKSILQHNMTSLVFFEKNTFTKKIIVSLDNLLKVCKSLKHVYFKKCTIPQELSKYFSNAFAKNNLESIDIILAPKAELYYSQMFALVIQQSKFENIYFSCDSGNIVPVLENINTSTERLFIKFGVVDEINLRAISILITHNKNIKDLVICSYYKIPNTLCFEELRDAFAQNTTIKKIQFCPFYFPHKTFPKLVDGFGKNNSITHYSFYDCKLSGYDIEFISEKFKYKNIIELSIRVITDDDDQSYDLQKPLLQLLKTNTFIKKLGLQFFDWEYDTFTKFCKLLKKCSLKRIVVYVPMGRRAEFIMSIMNNKTLTTICVENFECEISLMDDLINLVEKRNKEYYNKKIIHDSKETQVVKESCDSEKLESTQSSCSTDISNREF